MSYPEEPGCKSGDDTTQEAAASMSERAVVLRSQVLSLLKKVGPRTAHEIAAALSESDKATSPRISELRRMGLVEDTTERRLNASGRSAIVWRTVQ